MTVRGDDDESEVKILISTDNHLGFMEKDPVRGEDSFRSFHEVLAIAKANSVDMVLLGGDLFHDNKPSRRTVVRTMQLLRKMCLGNEEVHLAVRNDGGANGGINYMDENHAVSLPIFIIHGNHDDPTGAAGLEALSALDILSEASLVTYFGKVQTSKRIDVSPILLEKGATKVALYGLGNIRDELLYDTWCRQRKVYWQVPNEGNEQTTVQPQAENLEADDDLNNEEDSVQTSKKSNRWFNLFVLHQNRVTRGSARGITDTLLPRWLNYVVWGHEHDSQPELNQNKPPIVQPGSTVATSLSAGEAKPKHVILLKVNQGSISHRAIPLRTVRRFEFDDIAISEEDGLNLLKPESVSEFLAKKVNHMIERQETIFDTNLTAVTNHSTPLDGGGFLYPPHEWYKKVLTKTLRQPLVRLRVQLGANWETLNSQRFGQQFVGRCACSSEILHFYRLRRIGTTRPFLSGTITGAADEGDGMSGREYAEELQQDAAGSTRESENCRIPKLVQYYLYHRKAGGTGLEFLEYDKLSHAVNEFVDKAEVQAIPTYVTSYMHEQKRRTIDQRGDGEWDEEASKVRFKELAKQAANRSLLSGRDPLPKDPEDDDDEDEDQGNTVGDKKNGNDDDGNPGTAELPNSVDLQKRVEDDLEETHAIVSMNPRLAKLGKIAEANARAQQDSDDDSPEETPKRGHASARGRGRGRGRARSSAVEAPRRRKGSAASAARPPPSPAAAPSTGRSKRQAALSFSKSQAKLDSDDDDDIQDADDRAAEEAEATMSVRSRRRPGAATFEISDDEIVEVESSPPAPAQRGRKRRATAQPTSAARPRARTKRESQNTSRGTSAVSTPRTGTSVFAARARRRNTPTVNLEEDD